MAGYIGSKASVVSSGVENKKVITATAGQTAFTGLTYSPNRVHVFQNGVRLVDGTDYTATDGNSLTLTVGASVNDQVVVVSYNTFQTSDTVSASAGGTFTGDVNFTGAFTSQGIDDNATSTAMTLDGSGNLLVGQTSANSNATGIGALPYGSLYSCRDGGAPFLVNRKTSDGDIALFQKDGTTVGSIGSRAGVVSYIALDPRASGVNGAGLTGGSVSSTVGLIAPTNGAGVLDDAAIELGTSQYRFKDLYLSGGVFLGGTGSSNKLDDYEEGTFTATLRTGTSGTFTLNSSANLMAYVKIGRRVWVTGRVIISTATSPVGGEFYLGGLPYTITSGPEQDSGSSGSVTYYDSSAGAYLSTQISNVDGRVAGHPDEWRCFKSCATMASGDQITFSFNYLTT